MKLLERVERVPAGTFLVPMLMGAVIHTFCPQILEIGDPTEIFFTSKGMTFTIGFLMLLVGTKIKVSDLGQIAKKGSVFIFCKLLLAYGCSYLVLLLFGPDGFAGISHLAFTAAFTGFNVVLYIGVVRDYCDQVDYGIFAVLFLLTMPVFPLWFLSSSAGASIDPLSILSYVIPFAVGFLLGNLDDQIARFFAPGMAILMPVLGFEFGGCVDLRTALREIPSGLLLTGLYYVVMFFPMYAVERKLLHRVGYGSIGTCLVAGVALSVPVLAGQAVPALAPYVQSAVAQVALAVIVTTFTTPFLTSRLANRNLASRTRPLAERAATGTAPKPGQ